MIRFARAAFDLLYTRFAGVYDLVANLVSFGEWREWGAMALSFIPDDVRVLEIGHGPGHLHARIRARDLDAVGIDLSPQMGRLARRNLSAGGRPPRLARANAARLPFADATFGCVVSTFPAAFIFDPTVLAEIYRVLQPGGRAVIVPGVRLIKEDPLSRLARLAFRLTSGRTDPSAIADAARARFETAGFSFWQRNMGTERAAVTVWVLRRG
ncbi:MAG: methyltransferase domain-containing protein [Thermoflexales bacterium]